MYVLIVRYENYNLLAVKKEKETWRNVFEDSMILMRRF